MTELKIKKIFSLVAFYSVALFALTLVLDKINIFGQLSSAINDIVSVVAITITAVYAFFYVKEKKHIAYIITYVVSIILLIVFAIVLPLVG